MHAYILINNTSMYFDSPPNLKTVPTPMLAILVASASVF